MHKPLVCHHCGLPAVERRHGGDLTCSPDCQENFHKARAAAEDALRASGFTQHVDVPNLWGKDGVHLSIDQVIREGFEPSLALHGETVQEIGR